MRTPTPLARCRARHRAAVLLVGALAAAPLATAAAQQRPVPAQTPAPGDVPQPVPGDVGLAGSERPDIARFLNVRSVSGASLAPDGVRLSYITGTTGQPQLWVAPTAGGAPRQLTFGEWGVTFQGWSPTGDWIAYGADRAGDEREGFYLVSPDGTAERELLAPSAAYRAFGGWSPDGRRIAFASTERNGADFDVYVLDVAATVGTGRPADPRRLVEGRGGLFPVSWRPDGGALLLSQTRGEADNDVYLVDVASGRVDTLFRPADAASHAGFSWTPDGRGFYMASNQDRDLTALAHYDVAQRRLRWIATPEAEVEGVALSRDGRWLAWTVNENGYSRLHVRDLRDGRDVPPPAALPPGVYGLEWAERAPLLAVSVAGPAVAGDVWSWNLAAGTLVRSTESSLAGLDPRAFVVPEAVSFPSWDGEVIHGLLYLPRAGARQGGGQRPPVLLGVHGGPTSQARPTYSPAFQYLLSRGIAVLDLNFRGSTGYGKRFTRLDNQRLRPNAVKDMAGALDWLGQDGRVDTARAAVMGGSYGGYMTFAALTTLPGRFDAGVGFVGVSNWVTALEGASPALKASDVIEYGNIDDAAERAYFTSISPITYVDSVRAPLMVLHGANDPRDPVAEADQLVRAIRARGGDVEYLRFPDEGHGIRKLSNRVIAYRRIARFLERTLAPAAVVP